MSAIVIETNDVFEELSEENKRLLNDISFANECLIKLINLKTFIELIFDKIRYNLEENDCQKYQELSDEANEVLQRRPEFENLKNIDNKIIGHSVDDKKPIKLSPHFAEDSNEFSDDSDNTEDPDYEITTERLNISNKNKLNKSKSLVKRATNSLNAKNSSKRGRKPKTSSNICIQSNGIKQEKELITCDYDDCDQEFKTSKSYETHKRVVHLKIKPYACDYPDCDYRAQTRQGLNFHLVSHSDEKPIVCEVNDCGKRFKTDYQLKNHQKFVHKLGRQLFRCQWSGCKFETAAKSYFDMHMTKHTITERTVACDWPECDKMFRTQKQMLTHRRLMHTIARNLSCDWPGCQFRTFKKSILKQHVDKHSDVRPFVCDIGDCRKGFKTFFILKIHKTTHLKVRPFTCPYPDCDYSGINKSQLEHHQVSHSDERPFVCQFKECDKKFKLEAHLKKHEKFVHKVCAEILRCEWPGCEFETVWEKNLQLHIMTHTVRERTVACDWPNCPKMFKTRPAMTHHRRIHTAAKSHSCSWPGCQYKTNSTSGLRQHMLTHSDERRFVCEIDNCGKAFKTNGSLEYHKSAHFPPDKRDFKCLFEGCGKDFKTDPALKKHAKSHSAIEMRCDWPGCTYITNTTRKLNKHVLIHKDYSERKYVCVWPECGKRFTEKSHMDDHYRQHTNERRYACTYPGCIYRCVIRGNLKKHMTKHSR